MKSCGQISTGIFCYIHLRGNCTTKLSIVLPSRPPRHLTSDAIAEQKVKYIETKRNYVVQANTYFIYTHADMKVYKHFYMILVRVHKTI